MALKVDTRFIGTKAGQVFTVADKLDIAQTKVETDAKAAQATLAGKTPVVCNVSPREKSWRLVHDERKVILLDELDGETWTMSNLFCGTEKECQDEIARLALTQDVKADVVTVDAKEIKA